MEIFVGDIGVRQRYLINQISKLKDTFEPIANTTRPIPPQTQTTPSSTRRLLSQILIPPNDRSIRYR